MKNNNFKKAYSLLELSIVMVIVSTLITGGMAISINNISKEKAQVTRDRMQEIYKSMGHFLLENGRLPCPASLTGIRDGDSDYGDESDNDYTGNEVGCSKVGVYRSTANNELYYGMVPIYALGLPNYMAEDAFGNKISYIIHQDFTSADSNYEFATNNTNYFPHPSVTNTISVKEKPSAIEHTIADDVIFVLLSHGANKLGAFAANSSTQNTRPTDSDEMNNDLSITSEVSMPNTASYDDVIISSSANSDDFDDIVLFKSRNDFIEDFDAMFLIPCFNADSFDSSAFLSGDSTLGRYYGRFTYANSACSGHSDIRLTMECGPYGEWIRLFDACP